MALLVSASQDIKLHDWKTGVFEQDYSTSNADTRYVKSVSWGKDGAWIVIVPGEGLPEVVSVKNGIKKLHSVYDVQNPTYALFENGTKKNIAVSTQNGQLLVYDIKARSVRKRFPKARSSILQIDYNYKDTHIAAACQNGDILVYNNLTVNISSTFNVPDSKTVSKVKFHRNKKNFLAAGSMEGIVAMWDVTANKLKLNVPSNGASISDLTFSPVRVETLVSAGLDRCLRFFDVLEKNTFFEAEVPCSISALDFSSDGVYLAVGSQKGDISVYDTRNFSLPITSFIAHQGKKINQLLFQKVLTSPSNTSLMLSVTTDKIDNVDNKEKTPLSNIGSSNDDSFLTLLRGWQKADIAVEQKNPLTHIDSFTEGSPVVDPFVATSTPKLLPQECALSNTPPVQEAVAPSVPKSVAPSIEELRQIVRSVVRDEVKNVIASELNNVLKEEMQQMKFYIWEEMFNLRRCVRDVQVTCVQHLFALEELAENNEEDAVEQKK